jgi:hypothetical protein
VVDRSPLFWNYPTSVNSNNSGTRIPQPGKSLGHDSHKRVFNAWVYGSTCPLDVNASASLISGNWRRYENLTLFTRQLIIYWRSRLNHLYSCGGRRTHGWLHRSKADNFNHHRSCYHYAVWRSLFRAWAMENISKEDCLMNTTI